jgi:ABC-type nitrate/sulfonate/bicarbonate transport system ATPase subunit
LKSATKTVKVSVAHVNVTFGAAANAVDVLTDIDLDVHEGEFICLLGPSGCGKSTLLNIIGGFLKPTAGIVRIDDEPVNGPDQRHIFVFQESGVLPWLTVEGNVGFGLKPLPGDVRSQHVARYVELVGLTGFEYSYPHELSGGMKQRVEVARALAMEPDVLLLDEPFGALDSITRLEMRKELTRIFTAEKKTVLFVTHDIEESLQLSERIVLLSNRPARIAQIFDIDIPRPRDLSSLRYVELRDAIVRQCELSHVDTAIAPSVQLPPSIAPLPSERSAAPESLTRTARVRESHLRKGSY